MNNPLVSVIIPVFNCEKYLVKAIRSITEQSYKNIEILIGDDASTDSSWELIQTFKDDSRIKSFRSLKNSRKIKLFNELLSQCTGEYVTSQDADDWSHKDRLLKQVNFLQNNSSYIACGTQLTKTKEDGTKLFDSNFPTSYSDILDSIDKGIGLASSTFMILRNELVKIGGYRSEFSGICGEDEDLILRLISSPIANLPDVLYFYRQVPDSLSLERAPTRERYAAYEFARELYYQRKKTNIDWIDQQDTRSIQKFFQEKSPSLEKVLYNQVMTYLLIGELSLASKQAKKLRFGIPKLKLLIVKLVMIASPIHPVEIKSFLRNRFK